MEGMIDNNELYQSLYWVTGIKALQQNIYRFMCIRLLPYLVECTVNVEFALQRGEEKIVNLYKYGMWIQSHMSLISISLRMLEYMNEKDPRVALTAELH